MSFIYVHIYVKQFFSRKVKNSCIAHNRYLGVTSQKILVAAS